MDLADALSAFLHLSFTFNLKYPQVRVHLALDKFMALIYPLFLCRKLSTSVTSFSVSWLNMEILMEQKLTRPSPQLKTS